MFIGRIDFYICISFRLCKQKTKDVSEKIIDIRKVISEKNPRMAKLLPGFIIHYLKRVIHEDEVNKFLNEHGHRVGYDFLREGLKFLEITYEIHGLENLNNQERYVFVSNHPLGGLDGMILLQAIGTHFGGVKVPSNDVLMKLKPLACFFIPVNKYGAQSHEVVKQIDETFASSVPILNFPAGLCSRKRKGKIEDLEWQKSFIVKSVLHKRQIVPVYFQGKNSNFFYNLARIRQFFGIKLNLEMLYLADEMFKQRGQHFTIIIGKPIDFQTFDKSHKPSWWANWVKQQVYALAEK